MYSVKAKVLNLFSIPASEKYDASWKVQLLGETELQDGQKKNEMLTLSVPQDVFNGLAGREGEDVTMPISFFVSNNRLNPFFPKGAKLNESPV